MNSIKHELQNIIFGDEPVGGANQLKKVQVFLRGYAEASITAQKQQRLKSEETAELIIFAQRQNLFYTAEITEENFINSGAEQRVYRLDGAHVIKTNASIFYEFWLDYFNSLLIHNYLFPVTAYTFIGFKIIDGELNAVVKQAFIAASQTTNLAAVKQFLEHNHFINKHNNDYFNSELGIIFEDLHDENVLSNNDVLFFIDTIFYLTEGFSK